MPVPDDDTEPWTVQRLIELLTAARLRGAHESDLQAAIAAVLDEAGAPYQREVRLGAAGRVDFTVGRIGLEVKVTGSVKDVRAQLARYAEHDDLDAVVLVTRCLRHKMPDTLRGKPIHVIHLWGALL